MGERLLIAFLSGTVGVLIGLFSPALIPAAQQAQQMQQAWLDPPTRTPAPTPLTLSVSRPAISQTAAPPTLQAVPTATPEPTPPVRTFVIALEGGGEMRVVATDRASARNNVRSAGAVPAD